MAEQNKETLAQMKTRLEEQRAGAEVIPLKRPARGPGGLVYLQDPNHDGHPGLGTAIAQELMANIVPETEQAFLPYFDMDFLNKVMEEKDRLRSQAFSKLDPEEADLIREGIPFFVNEHSPEEDTAEWIRLSRIENVGLRKLTSTEIESLPESKSFDMPGPNRLLDINEGWTYEISDPLREAVSFLNSHIDTLFQSPFGPPEFWGMSEEIVNGLDSLELEWLVHATFRWFLRNSIFADV